MSTLERILFGLRGIMLIGAAGALFGSILMFLQGCLFLAQATAILLAEGASPAKQVTVPVLEAIDSFLFGVVLVIFAFGIAVGFVIKVSDETARTMPQWMKIEDISQLKRFLAEVVIIVLIVIFARIIVEENDGSLEWTMLVLPISILLLSAALFLLERGHEGRMRIGPDTPANDPEAPKHIDKESVI